MTQLSKIPTVIAVESVTLKKATASSLGDLKLLPRVLREYTSFSFTIIFSRKKSGVQQHELHTNSLARVMFLFKKVV